MFAPLNKVTSKLVFVIPALILLLALFPSPSAAFRRAPCSIENPCPTGFSCVDGLCYPDTPTPTATSTATTTETFTPTATATDTPMPTATPTATATETFTPTATATDTPMPTATPTATATDTPMPTATAIATTKAFPFFNTATSTATRTATQTIAYANIWPECGGARVTVSGTGIYTLIIKVDGVVIQTMQLPAGSYPVAWPAWVKNDICHEHQASVQVGNWTHGPVAFGGESCCALEPVVLQQGLNGYVGAQDTWLNQWAPATNHVRDAHLRNHLSGAQAGLLRFDLSALPANATIISATLSLAADGYTRGPAAPQGVEGDLALAADIQVNDPSADFAIRLNTLEVYRLLRPWSATQANWQKATEQDSWGAPGANGASDRDAVATGTASITINFRDMIKRKTSLLLWYRANVTALAQDWLSHPEQNYGVQIRFRDDLQVIPPSAAQSPYIGGYPLASSDFWMIPWRPMLTIIYTAPQ
jgi:hypothetical protein